MRKGHDYPLSLMRPRGLERLGHSSKVTQQKVMELTQTRSVPILYLCTGLPHAKPHEQHGGVDLEEIVTTAGNTGLVVPRKHKS